MSDSPLLQDLNDPQRQAVTTTDGPVLVIAGAGSGKTRVITHRIAYLIAEKNVAPWEIFAATFTNKAAAEMKARVAHLCIAADTARLPIATFHSHCARILRAHADAVSLTPHFTICDETDQRAVLRDCIQALGIDTKQMNPASVAEVIGLAKMRLLDGAEASDFIRDVRGDDQASVYDLYHKRLRENDAVDFDDLLLLVVRMWRERADILRAHQKRFRYVLVDEYQDTNLAQYEIVHLLAAEHRNLCVVGDEDQSIYSWRGAEITNLLEFEKHFPDAVAIRLEQNYRSTGNILEAASALIARNTQRLGKTLWTAGEKGDPVIVINAANEWDEARRIVGQIIELEAAGMPLREIALFYRIHALSRVYEEALREAEIPYRVVGGVRFYDRAEIKDLLAYLQVIDNPGNTLALLRVINRPRRGLGDTSVSRLQRFADEGSFSIYEVMNDAERIAEAGVRGKGAAAAALLARRIAEWVDRRHEATVRELVQIVLTDTDYETGLGDPKSIEVLSRLENIQAFLDSLDQFREERPSAVLGDYLETIALRGGDEDESGTGGGVSLMTVHNAKGLEFDVVFVVALEDKVFPNLRAVSDQGHKEEERRLFYVALTRARKRVYLCHSDVRRLWGSRTYPTPSIFLHEIPSTLRKRLSEVDLAPPKLGRGRRIGGPARRKAPRDKTPDKHESSTGKRFMHAVLGEVEIVAEEETGVDRRFVVRDSKGATHTLMAAHARLEPLAKDAPDDDDSLPF